MNKTLNTVAVKAHGLTQAAEELAGILQLMYKNKSDNIEWTTFLSKFKLFSSLTSDINKLSSEELRHLVVTPKESHVDKDPNEISQLLSTKKGIDQEKEEHEMLQTVNEQVDVDTTKLPSLQKSVEEHNELLSNLLQTFGDMEAELVQSLNNNIDDLSAATQKTTTSPVKRVYDMEQVKLLSQLL